MFSKKILLVIGICTGFSGIAAAQTLEDMKKQFPDNLAVFTTVDKSIEISFKNGEPYAKEFETSEMMVLDEKGNGQFNRGRVYQSHFRELKKIEAYTITPDGKLKVKDYKTESSTDNSVFYDDVKEVSFDYPQMIKGSIAHVESEHYNKDVRFLPGFYVTSYLPVNKTSYTITFPADMDVRYIVKNDDKKQIKITESQKGKKKKIEFVAENVKEYESYGDAPSYTHQAMHVIVYVAGYKRDDEYVNVFSSLDELYKWNAGFIKDVNSVVDDHVKNTTATIIKGLSSDKEKAQAIYNWVQDNIKYVAFEEGLDGFVPRKAADVCSKRFGDCKDMASLLTAMLNLAGVKAYFTWIGTRSIPYTYSEVPLPITDNHMICAANINNEWIFLDATDPNCRFGFPTSGIQGKQALISITDKKYELITVPIVPAEKNIITDSTFLEIDNNTLLGSSKVDYDGYFGSDVYNSLIYNKGDDERVYARRRLAKGSNKFIMKDYAITLSDTLKRIANISGTFEIKDYVKSVGDEMYINLNLEKLFYTTVIDTVKRKVPIENEYLYTINQIHALTVPAKYVIDYCPDNFSVENSMISFSINYKRLPGKVLATQKLVIKKLLFNPEEFKELNAAILQISKAYKEQLVLKKK